MKDTEARTTQDKAGRRKRLGWVGLGAIGLLLGLAIHGLGQSGGYELVERLNFWVGTAYRTWFSQQQLSHPGVLLGLSFVGGLVASVSPCILSLLPVNLSYIGTREVTSRRDALVKAIAFVLGVATVLSILGLFSSLAGIVLVQYRGYFQLAVGSAIVVMALNLVGVLRLTLPQSPFNRVGLPLPSPAKGMAIVAEPYGVGLTFALVSSPCTSPIMFAVLAAAAATGSQWQSILAMFCYALGYTAIIFLASLFTGLVKQTRGLLGRSQLITQIAGVALLLVGGFYMLSGLQWITAIFQ